MLRGKCCVASETRKVAQLGRNKDASLAIDLNLMRAPDIERLVKLRDAVAGPALCEFCDQRVPFGWRIKLQALFALENEIRDIQPIMTFALQDIAEAGGNTNPPLLVDRVVE